MGVSTGKQASPDTAHAGGNTDTKTFKDKTQQKQGDSVPVSHKRSNTKRTPSVHRGQNPSGTSLGQRNGRAPVQQAHKGVQNNPPRRFVSIFYNLFCMYKIKVTRSV